MSEVVVDIITSMHVSDVGSVPSLHCMILSGQIGGSGDVGLERTPTGLTPRDSTLVFVVVVDRDEESGRRPFGFKKSFRKYTDDADRLSLLPLSLSLALRSAFDGE